jgi:hypothetical protein
MSYPKSLIIDEVGYTPLGNGALLFCLLTGLSAALEEDHDMDIPQMLCLTGPVFLPVTRYSPALF